MRQDVYEGGIVGTQNVIDAVNASGSVRRLVYTSSMAAVSGGRAMPKGYEWTETDWANDGVDPEKWNSPRNAYARSKVNTEHFINEAADASGGSWDAITMNPSMICGPILFKAQVGQWIEQIGRLAGGVTVPCECTTNVTGCRRAVVTVTSSDGCSTGCTMACGRVWNMTTDTTMAARIKAIGRAIFRTLGLTKFPSGEVGKAACHYNKGPVCVLRFVSAFHQHCLLDPQTITL